LIHQEGGSTLFTDGALDCGSARQASWTKKSNADAQAKVRALADKRTKQRRVLV
jgi:hypothetical protein